MENLEETDLKNPLGQGASRKCFLALSSPFDSSFRGQFRYQAALLEEHALAKVCPLDVYNKMAKGVSMLVGANGARVAGFDPGFAHHRADRALGFIVANRNPAAGRL